ncbi:MAG: hypothetical protein ACKO7B_05665, partial [Flavobacteriales bacterium]
MTIRAIFKDYSITAKLLITIGACLVLTTLFSMAGMLFCNLFLGVSQEQLAQVANDYTNPTGIAVAKIMQVMMSFGFFILPPFILAFLFEGTIKEYLMLDRRINARALILVVLLMIGALPLVNAMGEWNSHMQLPAAFSSVEEWMRAEEDRLEQLTKALLQMPSSS